MQCVTAARMVVAGGLPACRMRVTHKLRAETSIVWHRPGRRKFVRMADVVHSRKSTTSISSAASATVSLQLKQH